MTIVAVYETPDNMEGAVDILSTVTSMSKYDAASRLRFSGKVPVIVGAYAGSAEANDVSAKLSSAGLQTIVREEEEWESHGERFVVRTFSFEQSLLRVESRHKDESTIDYGDVSLILCGKGIMTETESFTETSTKFNLGRAVMTSGLVMTKKEEKHHEQVTENREGVIHLIGKQNKTVVFRESDLDYASLGDAMKPTRYANFTYIANELKKRCRNATYGDSLLNKNVQMQILGPLFDPEEHLDIAIDLVTKFKRESGEA